MRQPTPERVPCAVQIVTETIPALQKLKEQGLVRAIGITGLPLDIYSYVLDRCASGGDAELSASL